MKTLLLTVLLITSAVQADQWLVNGRTYKGTLHKLNDDRTLVYVTSDWDNYGGSWIKVADLDPATRVRLNVATPQEQAFVQAQQEQIRLLEAQAAAQAQVHADAERAARIEEQKLALEREKFNFQRQQEARRMAEANHKSSTQIYIVPNPGYSPTGYPQYGYPQYGYPQTVYPQTGYPKTVYPHHNTHRHYPASNQVPRVPYVPVPVIPQVPQPILIRTN